jgi:cytochrome bd-type quinol oxidase subunit 2
MKKNKLKNFINLGLMTALLILPFFVFAGNMIQGDSARDKMLGNMNTVANEGGYDINANLGMSLGFIINTALGLLGTIFIIVVIIGGYNYLTAGGNDQTIEKAKKYIKRAIIGTIITFSAWVIWNFILNYIS